jgi:hypothetical protein
MAKEQNKATQAQNAVVHSHHAVEAAENHPSDRLISEAERSLRHSQAAVDQALASSGNEGAVSSAVNQLSKDQAEINKGLSK